MFSQASSIPQSPPRMLNQIDSSDSNFLLFPICLCFSRTNHNHQTVPEFSFQKLFLSYNLFHASPSPSIINIFPPKFPIIRHQTKPISSQNLFLFVRSCQTSMLLQNLKFLNHQTLPAFLPAIFLSFILAHASLTTSIIGHQTMPIPDNSSTLQSRSCSSKISNHQASDK